MTQRRLALAGLVAMVSGIVIAIAAGIRTDDTVAPAAAPAATTAPPPPTTTTREAPKPVRVELAGLRGYDPEGDGREQDATAPLATDGDPATAWQTENYRSFFKNGVGLLLDAGAAVSLTRVVVTTNTPGVSASIRVGQDASGPFTAVSPAKKLGRSTTFALRPRKARYVVVWVEEIPTGGTAEIGEVSAWRGGAG